MALEIKAGCTYRLRGGIGHNRGFARIFHIAHDFEGKRRAFGVTVKTSLSGVSVTEAHEWSLDGTFDDYRETPFDLIGQIGDLSAATLHPNEKVLP